MRCSLFRVTGRRGMGLLEVVFGIAMMSLVFWSLFGVFRLSIQIVISSKAKVGALALANERIEFIRSLSYDAVGTLGGIPSGVLAQTESIELNQMSYTRRTFVQYIDAPQDGAGAADSNGIMSDYKVAKVEVSWEIKGDARSYSLVTSIVPSGMESLAGGGTIFISVLDAFGLPLSGAEVRVANATTDPAIDVATFSNADGLVVFPGAPAASGYHITATKAGYSTAQTYESTATNPNPNPAHLSVVEAQTTNATLAIDRLSSLVVFTYEPIKMESFEDTFDSGVLIVESSSTTVATGSVTLMQPFAGLYEPAGSIISETVAPPLLYHWGQLSWQDTVPPSTSVRYYLLYENAPDAFVLIPDALVPGNAAGFTAGPVDLSGVPITYPRLRLMAELATVDQTISPSIQSWALSYERGPIPVPSAPFTLRGTKIIGSDASSQPLYKYDAAHTTDGTGREDIDNLEWDTYLLSVDDVSSGWDVAESCPFQPFDLSPGVSATTTLYLVPNSTHSLLLAVQDATGSAISGASIRLYRTGYDETQTGSSCGQTFFDSLLTGTYTIEVGASGYQSTTVPDISIVGDISLVVNLESL